MVEREKVDYRGLDGEKKCGLPWLTMENQLFSQKEAQSGEPLG